GWFRIGPFGAHVGRQLHVRADGFATRVVLVWPINGIDRARIELERLGPAIHGQIVDRDHAPIPDALVGLLLPQRIEESVARSDNPARLRGQALTTLAHTTRTDADGQFELRRFDQRSGSLLVVGADTFGTQWRLLSPADDSEDDRSDLGEFVLDPECWVHCTLIDGEATRIPGLEVTLSPLDRDALHEGFERHLASQVTRLLRESGTANDDGVVEFRGLAVGSYRVEVVDSDFLASRELLLANPGDSVDITMTVELGSNLCGTVVDSDGAGLAKVRVHLRSETEPSRPFPPVVTDERGEFSFTGLAAGTYSVRAATKFEGEFTDIEIHGVRAGDRSVLLRLAPLMPLFGTASTSSGDPVSNAWILLFDRPDESSVRPKATAVTNDRGEFRFSVPAGRTYRLLAWPSLSELRAAPVESIDRVYESADRVELRGLSPSDSPVEIRFHD
ncbi:MAG: carboxypeptidase regulatory-like domain-containing protein, partial [Planctomycetes bacterium]|nr:carboxypeptidase regulatory-like domain-containing protein [Planctomycetota bacterium]